MLHVLTLSLSVYLTDAPILQPPASSSSSACTLLGSTPISASTLSPPPTTSTTASMMPSLATIAEGLTEEDLLAVADVLSCAVNAAVTEAVTETVTEVVVEGQGEVVGQREVERDVDSRSTSRGVKRPREEGERDMDVITDIANRRWTPDMNGMSMYASDIPAYLVLVVRDSNTVYMHISMY